jgi:AraC-like DNA-binding protein
MESATRPPRAPGLERFVRSLGTFEGELPPARERVLPTADVSLIVNLHEDELRTYHGPEHETVRRTGGAALSGPPARHTVIDTEEQRALVCVDFQLGGAAAFLGLPLEETRDELVDLGELWGREGAVLRERLLEAAPGKRLDVLERVLIDHLQPAHEPDPAVAAAVRALERGDRVSDVTTRLEVLPKRFVRRFRARIGLTPKRFARVRRLQRLLGAVAGTEQVEWAGVAAEHGFYDQAHLIHDFRELTGLTPTAYRPRAADEWNHVPVA